MASTNDNKAVQLERERRVWELSAHGWTQQRIAGELGVSQSTVSRILSRVWAREREALDRDVGLQRAIVSGQIENLYDEAMQAWDRSKQPRKRSSQRQTAAGGDGATVRTVEAVDGPGDVGFLRAALEIWDRYVELWGLAAPPKLPVETKDRANSVSGIALQLVGAERDYDKATG